MSQDRRARLIAYCSAQPKDIGIYEWFPLEGDPTPEQIAAAEREAFERDVAVYRKVKEEIKNSFNNYRDAGVQS